MLKRVIFAFAVACSTLLAGCAARESGLIVADWAPIPARDVVVAEWHRYMQTQLKDPFSAQIQLPDQIMMNGQEMPIQAFPESLRQSVFQKNGFVPIRTTDSQINAKNSFGGYVGWTHTQLMFYENRAIAYREFTEGSWRPWKFF